MKIANLDRTPHVIVLDRLLERKKIKFSKQKTLPLLLPIAKRLTKHLKLRFSFPYVIVQE